MRKATFVVMLSMLVVGAMAVFSVDRVQKRAQELSEARTSEQAATPAAPTLDQLKKDFVQAAGIQVAHNDVWSRVGETRWENEVKPQYLRLVLLRVVNDTNNPLPSSDDVIRWLREHPGEGEKLLRQAEETTTPGR